MRADELRGEHVGAGFVMTGPPVSGVIGDVEQGGPFPVPGGGDLPPPFAEDGWIPRAFTTHVVLRPLEEDGSPFHVWLVPGARVQVTS